MKILMRNLSILLTLSIASSALANNTRDGIYLGAGIGSSSNHYELDTTGSFNNYTLKTDTSQRQFVGNIFAGYGYTFPNLLFVGGELGANFPSHSATINNRPELSSPGLTVSDTLKMTDYVTLDVLPGFAVVENVLVYARAGVVYGSLTQTQPARWVLPGFSVDENKWGGRLGLGGNFALNNEFGIGLDYIYTSYQDLDIYTSFFQSRFASKGSRHYIGLSVLYRLPW